MSLVGDRGFEAGLVLEGDEEGVGEALVAVGFVSGGESPFIVYYGGNFLFEFAKLWLDLIDFFRRSSFFEFHHNNMT